MICLCVYLSVPAIVGSSMKVCARAATVGVGVDGEVRQGVVELPIAERLSSIGEVREVGVGSVGALSLVAPTFLL